MNYESWRISYQDPEQAAKTAYNDVIRLHQQLHQLRLRLQDYEARCQCLDEILTARLARCVAVEQRLMNMAGGKEPLPDVQTCRELALKLGIPDKGYNA